MPSLNLNAAQRSLLGTALGDSLGLPYEGISGARGCRIFPLPVRQRLVFGFGFVSDDTVQSGLVLRALLASQTAEGIDYDAFAAHFAKLLRKWFLSVPPGVGLSTVKACLRLCVGVGAKRSGIPSAGNGAAMRAAVLGAALADAPEVRIAAVKACSTVTHTDARAIAGAQLIALAAALQTLGQVVRFEGEAATPAPAWAWSDFGPAKGPTGYVVHSVNCALRIWREAKDFPDAIERVIRLGGDTDTVGAMVGGIFGAKQGDFPDEWNRYFGWPQPGADWGRDVSYFRLLGPHLAALPVILVHGFRRLLPPY